jgi:hypothetical protein
LAVLALLSVQALAAYTQQAARVARHPLIGAYRVEGFPGWQQVVVENVASMRVMRDNGTISTYRMALNDSQSRLQLGDPNNPAGSLTFRISGEEETLEATFTANLRGCTWCRRRRTSKSAAEGVSLDQRVAVQPLKPLAARVRIHRLVDVEQFPF